MGVVLENGRTDIAKGGGAHEARWGTDIPTLQTKLMVKVAIKPWPPGPVPQRDPRGAAPARAVADDKVGVDQLDLEVRLSQPLGVAREYNAMAIQVTGRH